MLQDLKMHCNSNLVASFKQDCQNIIKESIDHYDSEASQYDKKVYSKIRKQIEEQIFKDLLFCFDS